MSDGIAVARQFVGVDLHLRRSVIARIDDRGREVDCVRIDNERSYDRHDPTYSSCRYDNLPSRRIFLFARRGYDGIGNLRDAR